MKVLVLGSHGQIGSEVLRARWAAGVALHGLARAELDIGDRAATLATVAASGAELVVNAAAYTAVDRAEAETAVAFRVNRDGAANVAAACAATGAALIHVSTDYVFDGKQRTPYREDDSIAPLGAYGKSKAAGEAAIRGALDRQIILRTAWVYGRTGQNFVKTMLRLGGERDELRVVADQLGSPTSAADIALAIAQIAAGLGDGGPWGTYHYTGAGEVTWHGFAEAVFDLAFPYTGRRPRVTAITTADYPTAAPRPAYSVLDCSKIAARFGIRPLPWRDSLARMLSEHFAAA
ncbi:MAG TPA: dTDP-4-dehydrorhamnose reductase [Stellaceae bacterium]|nr:dTDP-4-dehydrorhamnose reductase [Stellaceae bacterium]